MASVLRTPRGSKCIHTEGREVAMLGAPPPGRPSHRPVTEQDNKGAGQHCLRHLRLLGNTRTSPVLACDQVLMTRSREQATPRSPPTTRQPHRAEQVQLGPGQQSAGAPPVVAGTYMPARGTAPSRLFSCHSSSDAGITSTAS